MSGPVYKVGDPAPPPLPRRSEAEVTARWQGDEPVVSILCPSYQHVDFIEDALRGFLGQRTDFPFEVLVRDDASIDGTAEIVRDYSERYPNVIRSVLETENRWPQVKPLEVLEPMARGEFVAICDGDDYWINPRFLATGVRAILCPDSTPVSAALGRNVVVEDGNVSGFEQPLRDAWNWYLPFRSLIYRRDIARPRVAHAFGDNVAALQLQRSGEITHLDEFVAVYRRHTDGIWAGLSRDESHPRLVANYLAVAIYLASTGDLDLAVKYQNRAMQKSAWAMKDYGVVPQDPPGRAALALDRALKHVRGGVRAILPKALSAYPQWIQSEGSREASS